MWLLERMLTLWHSLPDAANLRRAIGIDHTLRVHLDPLPARLHPLPLLSIVPIDLRGVLQVWQLPGLHARWQVLGGDVVVLLVELVLNDLPHCSKLPKSIRHVCCTTEASP